MERLLSQIGIFVILGMDGTLCVSMDIFWDKLLMRVRS